MHELAVCQALLAEVGMHAQAQAPARVARITVQVGPLSGVVPDLLCRAYELARADTVAAQAPLVIEEAPVRVYCAACDAETAALPNRLVCGHCGDWRTHLRAGDELVLRGIEFIREEHVQ